MGWAKKKNYSSRRELQDLRRKSYFYGFCRKKSLRPDHVSFPWKVVYGPKTVQSLAPEQEEYQTIDLESNSSISNVENSERLLESTENRNDNSDAVSQKQLLLETVALKTNRTHPSKKAGISGRKILRRGNRRKSFLRAILKKKSDDKRRSSSLVDDEHDSDIESNANNDDIEDVASMSAKIIKISAEDLCTNDSPEESNDVVFDKNDEIKIGVNEASLELPPKLGLDSDTQSDNNSLGPEIGVENSKAKLSLEAPVTEPDGDAQIPSVVKIENDSMVTQTLDKTAFCENEKISHNSITTTDIIQGNFAEINSVPIIKKEPIHELPVQKQPFQVQPFKELPFQVQSVKELPFQVQPIKEQSVQVKPVKELPVQVQPVKEKSVQELTVKEQSVQGLPFQVQPVKENPQQNVPVQEQQVHSDTSDSQTESAASTLPSKDPIKDSDWKSISNISDGKFTSVDHKAETVSGAAKSISETRKFKAKTVVLLPLKHNTNQNIKLINKRIKIRNSSKAVEDVRLLIRNCSFVLPLLKQYCCAAKYKEPLGVCWELSTSCTTHKTMDKVLVKAMFSDEYQITSFGKCLCFHFSLHAHHLSSIVTQ